MEIRYHINTTIDIWNIHFANMNYMAYDVTDNGITVYTVDGMQTQYETDLDSTGLTYTKEETL